MTVVAGPPGSGKSVLFSVRDFGVDWFNVDDRCNELHGSYQSIPTHIRQRAQHECEHFVERHISDKVSFAMETTLGGRAAALQQARVAKEAGFFTSIVYMATSDVTLNIERIRLRGLAGGHSAPPEVIRKIYRQSLKNLAEALLVFHRAEVYDNSGQKPKLILTTLEAQVVEIREPVPTWMREALASSPFGGDL